MLQTHSLAPPPPAEKIVTVKILRSIYVAGKIAEVGETVSMGKGDAQALRASEPPTVEIL